MYWEFLVMKYIERHVKNKILDFILRVCSLIANGGVIFGVVLFFMYFFEKGSRTNVVYILVTMLVSSIIVNIILKPLFSRQRPFLTYENIIPLIKRPKDMSFPSGHTSAAFTFATALYNYDYKLGIVAYIYGVIVGFSRIYLQVHYPTDVLVGAMIGSLTAIIVNSFLPIYI